MSVIYQYQDDLIVREATLQDRSAVLAIIKPFEGLDYLPHKYDHFITNPRFYCYVAELGSEIVSMIELLTR